MLTLDFAQRLCNAFFGAKKKAHIAVSLDFIGAGGEVESPHTFVRWILRVPERDFHRKISIGYLPYFCGVERGAERMSKVFTLARSTD